MEEKKLTGYPSVDKPWMKFYQKDTILSEVPECTVYQNLYNHNKDYPNDIALMYFGKKITYAQLFGEVENAAKAFAAQGVKSGDNVTLCVPATAEGFEEAAISAGLSDSLTHALEGEYEIRFWVLEKLGELKNHFFGSSE